MNRAATLPGGGAAPAGAKDKRTGRYRQAESALWEHYGLRPVERFIELERPAVRLRILELGSGPPVLFVPGTAGAGPSWAPLVRELGGFRCLLLDPPNAGLSSRLDYSGREYGVVIGQVLGGVLDALGLDRTQVVGHSVGNAAVLWLAAAHPGRVGGIVLLGAGPVTDGYRMPGILRVIASPLGAIMVRLPPSRRTTRAFLRQIGHGPSLAAGRVPDELIDWRVAFDRDTDTMRNERDMLRAVASWQHGQLRPGVTFGDGELAGITQPTLLVYGTSDPTGTLEISRRLISLLPHAELRLVDGAGHVPWLDDPDAVGEHVGSYLKAMAETEENPC